MRDIDLKPSNPAAAARMVNWLGYGGLVPFPVFSVPTWTDHDHRILWHGYLLAYGAVILSFTGALHWGIAMASDKIGAKQRSAMFVWSVVPSLLAFFALSAHSVLGDIFLLVGFLLQFGMDLRVAARASLPAWYLPLRLRLSAIAMLCLAAGVFAMSA